MTFQEQLVDMDACAWAREWVADMPLDEAWAKCANPDWMLWLACHARVDQKAVVTVACKIARTALVHVPPSETRPLIAIETTEAWMRGEATLEDVRAARSVVYAYAAAYAATYAAAAADADADAAYVATYAADAAYVATYAAVADAADADAARKASRCRSCDIIREHVTAATIAALLEVRE